MNLINQKQSLIDYWGKNEIIKDRRVIEAFKKVRREDFIEKYDTDDAYLDHPLPIGHEQTISQPTTVMIMTEALELKPNQKVLEIGTGSGYQAALIAEMIKPGLLMTIEIIPELAKKAGENLRSYKNIQVIISDGSIGYEKESPYDRIIATAACPKIPMPWIEQLKEGGIILAPVGNYPMSQNMIKARKKEGKLEIQNLGDFVFVPLRGKHGFQ